MGIEVRPNEVKKRVNNVKKLLQFFFGQRKIHDIPKSGE